MNPFKPVHNFRPESKVFRARIDVADVRCANCGKQVFKQNEKQIVFFCSKKCRRELRNGKRIKKGKIVQKPGFRII